MQNGSSPSQAKNSNNTKDNSNNNKENNTNGTNNNNKESNTQEVKEEGEYVWTINKFSRIQDPKKYSDVFWIGGVPWKLLVFPRGNAVDSMSLYLAAYGWEMIPSRDWFIYALFDITLISASEKRTLKMSSQHRFCRKDSDWGFLKVVKIKQLLDPHYGYLPSDTLTLVCHVKVPKEENTPLFGIQGFSPSMLMKNSTLYANYHPDRMGANGEMGRFGMREMTAYNSKAETGYVGIKNQAATCYLNSLLQTLYHIAPFRTAVYQMPIPTDNGEPVKSAPISLALQKLFYRMQYDTSAPGTKELTKSFGWSVHDSFTQHDVQELNRVLCDRLEEKMKKTTGEGTIPRLFQGKLVNFIKCLNINYESTTIEPFYDLVLNVKGCRDIYDSFDQYTALEILKGDNQYHAEGYGLQDAKKGSVFRVFPPVLELVLKRFSFDFQKEAEVKINDRYVFPANLNLSKYVADDVPKGGCYTYQLHGVLVHLGDGVHGGHYYAYFRPTAKSDWFKFDDSRVTRATAEEAINDNYGGETEQTYETLSGRKVTSMSRRTVNAYMLVYVRDDALNEVFSPINDVVIQPLLKTRFEQDKALKLKRKKEKEEAHLYQEIRVAIEDDFKKHGEFDLVNFDKVRTFRVKKTATLKQFKEIAANIFKIDPNRQRYWNWQTRQNKTYRPDLPFSPKEEEKTQFQEMKRRDFFLEKSKAPKYILDESKFFPMHNEDTAFLLFKQYEPETEKITYIGNKILRLDFRIGDLIPILNQSVGYHPDTPILIFEEVKSNMVNALKLHSTIKEEELGNGDIVVIQRSVTLAEQTRYLYALAPIYYDHVHYRTTVIFRSLKKPTENHFEIELSGRMLYDQVAQKVGEKLECDPMKLRFMQHNRAMNAPSQPPIKRTDKVTLADMLTSTYGSNILYYEIMDILITELDSKKQISIQWQNSKAELMETYTISLPKEAKMSALIERISTMVPLEGTKQIRVLELWNNRIDKVFRSDTPVSVITDYYTKVRAEEIAEEELDMKSGDKLIKVAHFTREIYFQIFGNPFVLCLKANEKLSDIRAKIQKKLGVPDNEYKTWKIALMTTLSHSPEYLPDDYLLASHKFEPAHYLGLEHRHDPTNANAGARRRKQVPIKINDVDAPDEKETKKDKKNDA